MLICITICFSMVLKLDFYSSSCFHRASVCRRDATNLSESRAEETMKADVYKTHASFFLKCCCFVLFTYNSHLLQETQDLLLSETFPSRLMLGSRCLRNTSMFQMCCCSWFLPPYPLQPFWLVKKCSKMGQSQRVSCLPSVATFRRYFLGRLTSWGPQRKDCG